MAATTGAAAATPASASNNSRLAKPPINNGLRPSATPVEDARITSAAHQAAVNGCRALLRAQLMTGAHWIRDREAFAAACASVGLAA